MDYCHALVGEPYEFVPVEWLKKWLDDSTAIKEIDNCHFLCAHGKLHPDRLSEAKRISHSAAQILFSRYGGGPRIDGKDDSCIYKSLFFFFFFSPCDCVIL